MLLSLALSLRSGCVKRFFTFAFAYTKLFMMKKLLFLIAVLVSTASCTFNRLDYDEDDEINAETRSELQKLNKELFHYLYKNDLEGLKAMASDDLKIKGENDLESFSEMMSKSMKTAELEIINEFHVVKSNDNSSVVIDQELDGREIRITYQALNKESYVSMMISEKDMDRFMLLSVFGRFADGWKLNILQAGQYKRAGKTAPEHYGYAQELLDKDYLVSAARHAYFMYETMTPGHNMLSYHNEKEMKEFAENVQAMIERELSLPDTVNEIETQPVIFGIFSEGFDEGYFPLVNYKTSLDISDSTALKAENDTLHAMINEMYKGIKKANKYTVYRAFEAMPNAHDSVSTYGFVRENEISE